MSKKHGSMTLRDRKVAESIGPIHYSQLFWRTKIWDTGRRIDCSEGRQTYFFEIQSKNCSARRIWPLSSLFTRTVLVIVASFFKVWGKPILIKIGSMSVCLPHALLSENAILTQKVTNLELWNPTKKEIFYIDLRVQVIF